MTLSKQQPAVLHKRPTKVSLSLDDPVVRHLDALLHRTIDIGERIMATAEQVKADLEAIKVSQRKTITEIGAVQGKVTELNAKVQELQDLLATQAGNIPEEVVTLVGEIKDLAGQADAAIPDVPELPPEETV